MISFIYHFIVEDKIICICKDLEKQCFSLRLTRLVRNDAHVSKVSRCQAKLETLAFYFRRGDQFTVICSVDLTKFP